MPKAEKLSMKPPSEEHFESIFPNISKNCIQKGLEDLTFRYPEF